ncbi:MAG: hypothetical protein R3F34_03825 [Planctomycetota bacterium]
MSAKELRTDCPSCRARLTVDVRTEKVVGWRSADDGRGGGRAGVDDDDWSRAVSRAQGREGRGRDRFEAALAKQTARERDLDDLFDRAATRAGGRDRDFPGLGARPKEATPPRDRPWSDAWVRRLSRAELATLGARVRGAGGDVLEFGAARAAIGDGIAELFDVDLADDGDLARALEATALVENATARTLPMPGTAAVAARLLAHGWVPTDLDPVYFHDLRDLPPAPRTVRPAEAGDLDAWSRIVSRAHGVPDDERETHVARIAAQFGGAGWQLFLARDEGEDVAAAAMRAEDGVAVLAMAATLPDRRGCGHQRDLIRARLHAAVAAGCDVATSLPEPRGPSQSATERCGFALAFHQLLWVPRSDA